MQRNKKKNVKRKEKITSSRNNQENFKARISAWHENGTREEALIGELLLN